MQEALERGEKLIACKNGRGKIEAAGILMQRGGVAYKRKGWSKTMKERQREEEFEIVSNRLVDNSE